MRLLIICSLVLLGLGGCYSFSQTTLPAHLRTITIPPAENRTTQSVLGDKITKAAQDAFKRNASQLRQIPEDGQSELVLALRDYRNVPVGFSTGGVVNTYQVKLSIDVRFTDKVKKRDIYKKTALDIIGNYDLSKGETEDIGQSRALKEFQEVLSNNALSDW